MKQGQSGLRPGEIALLIVFEIDSIVVDDDSGMRPDAIITAILEVLFCPPVKKLLVIKKA
jgi:hypothetical protein